MSRFALFDELLTSPYSLRSISPIWSYFSITLLPGGQLPFWCMPVSHQPFPCRFQSNSDQGSAARLSKYQKFGGLQGEFCTLKDIHSSDHDLP